MKTAELYRTIVALSCPLALLAGCSDGAGSASVAGAPTYIRDIQPIVEAKCANCHVEGGIAPFALQTYEQVSAMRGPVAAAVASRTMPPWMAADGCTDYVADRSLTDEQIDLITRWADAGAPLGDPRDTPVTVEDERQSLSRTDLELSMAEPYTPQLFPDEYRCFFVDWPLTDTAYVTGFGTVPGNPAIVHHVIAYIVHQEQLSTFQALDDADPGPGWSCFGGPGGSGTGGNQPAWVGAWTPGGSGADFPEGTGIEIPAGSKLVVQMHYNSHGGTPAPDQTKLLVRVDKTVEKKAAVMPFLNPKWLFGDMSIPAHSKDTSYSFDFDPTMWIDKATAGALPSGKPLTIYETGMHMHQLGKQIMTSLDHADGTSECLMDVPRWNFHWQPRYRFRSPKLAAPGDKLHLECHWDNPGDAEVNWGEGTSDEMCLGVYYVTE